MTSGTQPYQRIELLWSAEDLQQGKLIKVRGFPTDKIETFRSLFPPTGRTLLLTTYLKIQQMLYKMCVMFVGKLRSFTVNLSS